MKNKIIYLSILLLSFFLVENVKALTAAEVANRGTDCPGVELAEAKEDGSLNKVSCYNTYQEAKTIMDTTANDNLVIVEKNRIVDAKYAFIDYDQYATLGYTEIYNTKDLSSRISYIAGGNSDDAVFLELDYQTGRIKIKVSGVVGWIKRYEVESSQTNILYDIVPLSWVTSPSFYEITASEIIHHLPINVYNTKGENRITIGKKPNMIDPGRYYSFDGNYFYTDLKVMINDYKSNSYGQSVNSTNPFYNYYQYLTFRSKTNYSAANINQYIDARTSNQNSKLKNSGDYFIDVQNKYGVNAILMLAIGINESSYGNSPIAQNKNNLFGLNAVDASPGLSADIFPSVSSCIDDFGFAWLSGKFLQPGDHRFNGANLGSKKQGINVKYASDPYWGEKAAKYYYDLDKYYGFQDYESYTIAILNNDYNNTVYPKKTPGGENVSSSFYQYKQKGSPIIILGEVTGPEINGSNVWYKILSDPTLDSNLNYYSDDVYYSTSPRINYNWEKNIVYVPASYFTKISNGGGQITPNPSTESTNPETSQTPNATPTPVVKPISSIVSEANYHYANGNISKISPGTTIETLKNNLTNTGGVIEITNANGELITSGNVGTGNRVVINSSGTIETLNVLIYGDTDGDGTISAVDYVRVKNHIMGSSQLNDITKIAADVNKDNEVSAVDYVNIKNYIMGGSSVIEN